MGMVASSRVLEVEARKRARGEETFVNKRYLERKEREKKKLQRALSRRRR